MIKPKILIVDDKLANILSMETLLNEIEAEYIRAQSGQEALKTTLDNDFALILMDLQMPEMDGFETIKLLRQVEKTKYIPIIIVSAVYSTDFYQIKGIKSGALDFISKPLNPHILIGKVEHFLELYYHKKKLEKEIELRKKFESQLEASKKHLELINKILRHDLLNNLVVIRSGYRLFDDKGDKEILKESFKFVEKSMNLIERMKQLEEFIEKRKDLLPIDINKHIQGTIENYENIQIKIKGHSHVLADESIDSVLENIIRNAIIHGKSQSITFDIKKKREKCIVKIIDDGIGIPVDIHQRIFEKDFISGETGRTGIGLYIVNSAMERYGGKVWVENNKPSGAIFILEFLNVG